MKKLQSSQIFRYIVTGGMTTVINYFIYILLTAVSMNYLLANTVAWAGAVTFAFYANKHMVFRSTGKSRQEFFQFFVVRILTLLLENLLLYLFIDCISLPSLASKVAVSVVTVVLNYFACKYSVFKEGGVTHE